MARAHSGDFQFKTVTRGHLLLGSSADSGGDCSLPEGGGYPGPSRQLEVVTVSGSTAAALSLETQKEARLPAGPDLGRGGGV